MKAENGRNSQTGKHGRQKAWRKCQGLEQNVLRKGRSECLDLPKVRACGKRAGARQLGSRRKDHVHGRHDSSSAALGHAKEVEEGPPPSLERQCVQDTADANPTGPPGRVIENGGVEAQDYQ